ncbi:O-antigen ligase family protein [Buttiauxella sp. A2-C1_F]|uniref:O-antigen ligase family protein n=1 Tax=Buttiauxella sp. A2-C1_F TaxID=2904526 RepID=UPI001E47938B|nr:O-antigen ligase family protein [Buttiauxella sp. A2-C1_F]MCE0847484.1 O-antigen ligase family protein [Buttiauxella sp. A2-C1_F]
MLLNKTSRIEKSYAFIFIAFIFFSAIFCNISKVNLFFHVSLILFIGTLIFSHKTRITFINDQPYLKGLIFPLIFLIYFSLSNLWSNNPGNISSTLKHALYLLTFICLYRQMEKLGYKKYVMGAVYIGMTLLSIFTLVMVDKTTLAVNRLDIAFPWAPDNVIDLGGYMAIGIFCGLIFIRETGKNWLYLLIPILLTSLLLTQSRGPLIAFIAAFILLFIINPRYTKQHIFYGLGIISIVIVVVFLTNFSAIFIDRLESLYQQSFIRFGIWQNALELAKQKLVWGWGFDQNLTFINSIGQNISTTHTIYLASLLKGGLIGFSILMMVIGYGLLQVPKHIRVNHKIEGSIFIFSLIYYMSQGMFIIGNPQEFWFLFWFPLSVILSTPIKSTAP